MIWSTFFLVLTPLGCALQRAALDDLAITYDNDVPSETRIELSSEATQVINRNAGQLTRLDIAELCASVESIFAEHGIRARMDVTKCALVNGHWQIRLNVVRDRKASPSD
jgi:hypothetical protein